MKGPWALLLAFLFACACADEPEKTPQAPPEGGVSSTGGNPGSGEVSIGGNQQADYDPYTKALEHIRGKDWDSARTELLKTLEHRLNPDQEQDARAKLKEAEQGIVSQPAQPVPNLISGKGFYDQRVSIRGKFASGGEVGYATQYFWLDDIKRLQCRYSKMPLAEKKAIAALKGGEKVLVRGMLKSPWGSNPDPYLEAEFLRVEEAR